MKNLLYNNATCTKVCTSNRPGVWLRLYKKIGAIMLLAGVMSFITPVSVFGQNNPAANLDQIRNGSATSHIDPPNWVNGNAGASNAHYLEGHSIAYRMILTNLSAGAHTLDIEWDTRDNNKAAIDYITHYQNLDPHAQFGHGPETIDPLAGLGLVGASVVEEDIPAPSVNILVNGNQQPLTSFNAMAAAKRKMTMFNGTAITGMSYLSEGALNTASAKTRMRITFTTSNSTVVFAWGGHIASQLDWGAGNSAVNINGSPYHTRLIALDGSGGNQDRSLAAAAVIQPPSCDVDGPAEICLGDGNQMYDAVTDASTPVYAWSIINNTTGASIVGADDAASVEVDPGTTAGSYEIQVSITKNGLTTICSEVTTVHALPEPDLGADQTITCTVTSVEVCPGGLNVGTNYDFSWTGPGGFVSSDSCITITETVNGAGVYTVVVTNVATGCEGTDAIEIFINNTEPELDLGLDVEIACGQTSIEICPGGLLSGIDYDFLWTFPDGVTTSTDSCLTAMAEGTYTLMVTNLANGCTDTDEIEVTVEVCETDMHCTLTQGGWGNANGRFCDGPRRLDLINNLLSGADLKIGGNDRFINFDQNEAACLIAKLPAGGTAMALPAGTQYNTCASIPTTVGKGKAGNTNLLSNGKFNNVLIGQVIALSLNMRLDATKGGNLGSVVLEETMTTYGATTCDENAEPIFGDVVTRSIPPSVLNYLTVDDVAHLLELANMALNGDGGLPSYADINQAVSAINELFDNCRMMVVEEELISLAKGVTLNADKLMKAYPNPFSDKATIEVSFAEAQDYSIVLYDIKGSVVANISAGNAQAGKLYTFEIDGTRLPDGMYFARLVSKDKVETIKLIMRR